MRFCENTLIMSQSLYNSLITLGSEYAFSPHQLHTDLIDLYTDLAVMNHQYNNPAITKEQIHSLYRLEECPSLQWGGKNIFCIMSSLGGDRQDPGHVFLIWGIC